MTSEIDLNNKTTSLATDGDNKLKSFSNALLLNFFSFIEESDLACFSSTCRLFFSLQKEYNISIIDKRYRAWIRILNSKPRIVNSLDLVIDFRLVNNHFFFSFAGNQSLPNSKRYIMDLTNLSITLNEMEYARPIQGSGDYDRVSVSFNDSLSERQLIVFDNEKKVQLYKIDLKNYFCSKILGVIGTKIKGQTLEFVTNKGVILQFDQNKFAEQEGDKKEVAEEQLNIIPCIPKDFKKIDSNLILESYKVKKTYYFKWITWFTEDMCCPVIALKDLNFPDQGKILQENSDQCVADDHFFYHYLRNVITIYKGETIWKKLIINEKFITDVFLYPTNYGLIVKFINNMTDTHISIWDHRVYNRNPEVVTLLFEKIFKNDQPRIYVRNDLLIYLENITWKVLHIPKKEIIGTMQNSIWEIATSNNSIPEYFIVQRGAFTKTDNSDFLIFSDKN